MIHPANIINMVAQATEVEPDLILSATRKLAPSGARMMAGWLIHHCLGLSLTDTARALGQRDHSTASYWMTRVEALMGKEADFKALMRSLSAQVELAIRLDGVSAVDVLEIARRVALSRVEAMKPSVNEIMGLGATFCALWDVALTADALAQAVGEETRDDELVRALAEAIRQEMTALCEEPGEKDDE